MWWWPNTSITNAPLVTNGARIETLSWELLFEICCRTDLQAVRALSRCSQNISRILWEEYFWRRQCHARGFTRPLPTENLPRPLNNVYSYRRQYHDHLQTARNWQEGRNQCRPLSLPHDASGGQVCLVLDGQTSRLVSSALPPGPLNTFLIDLETQQSLLSIGEEIVCAASLQNTLLACGLRDGCLSLRDLRRPTPGVTLIAAHGDEISSLSMPTSTCLVTGSRDCFIKYWDVRNLSTPCEVHMGASSVTAMTAKDGLLAVGFLNGDILLGNSPSSAHKLDSIVNCLQYDPSGRLLAGLDDGSLISLAQSKVKILHTGDSPIICMDSTPQRIVLGKANGDLVYGSNNIINGDHDDAIIEWHSIRDSTRGRGIIWKVMMDACRIISSSLDRRLFVHDFGPTSYLP